jgi:hypothetical protein
VIGHGALLVTASGILVEPPHAVSGYRALGVARVRVSRLSSRLRALAGSAQRIQVLIPELTAVFGGIEGERFAKEHEQRAVR